MISKKEKSIFKRIPPPIFVVWIFTLPIYLLLLSQQSSHLGNWPKPNELSDLFSLYNDSFFILTMLIPFFTILLTKQTKKNSKTFHSVESKNSIPIILTSFFWISVPLIFWIISHLTSLNLFVERYFIPKEVAITFLVACGLRYIFQKLPKQNCQCVTLLSTFTTAIILILVGTRRGVFRLNKDTCYHHSLIIEKSYPYSEQPIIIEYEPKYFPNAYLGKYECLYNIENESLIEVYKRFSTKIKFLE